MADRPQYPDSTGGWNAPPPSRRPDGLIDRTEPMNRPDRHGEATIDELMASRRSAPEVPAPPPNVGSSWSGAPVSTPPGPDAHMGDPELAAAAGIDSRGPDPYAVRSQPPEPPQAPAAPPAPPVPPTGGGQPETPFSGPPLQATGGIDEPTRLHNPVQHQQYQQHQQQQPPPPQPRRGYPEQVGDGVYRRSRKGLGAILALITIAMIGLVGFMLANQFTSEGPLAPSAALAGTFALAGLPLTAWGLYPLLGMGPQSGPDHYSALMRPPYAYLLTGLVLLLAAGLAA